jgi:hypothetical protein
LTAPSRTAAANSAAAYVSFLWAFSARLKACPFTDLFLASLGIAILRSQVVRLQAGLLGDAGQHRRADFIVVMKGPRVVSVSRMSEFLVRAGPDEGMSSRS